MSQQEESRCRYYRYGVYVCLFARSPQYMCVVQFPKYLSHMQHIILTVSAEKKSNRNRMHRSYLLARHI